MSAYFNMNNCIGITIIILIIAIILINIYNITFEKFTLGQGQAFGPYTPPHPPCTSETDCFPGSYFRSEVYQNMCEPKEINEGGLSKDKVQLLDTCVKTLGSQLNNKKYSYKCFKDKRGVDHCYWKQNF